MKNNFLILGFTIILISGACKTSQKYFDSGSKTSTTEESPILSSQNSIKILFGSCNDEDRAQPLWPALEAEKADLFLWLGDNIYGDSEDLAVLKKKYQLQNSHEDYISFKNSTPINGTWDDHDYGVNDGGKEFPSKAGSQQLLLDFLDIPSDHPRRNREGVYDKISLNKNELSIDIFLLDTRYFRDPVIGKKGEFKAESIGTILGKAQRKWLDQELAKSDADIHIFVSSIQLIPEEHGWEKWANFPEQKTKFLDLISSHNINHPIILSGDRHLAEFSMQQWKGYTFYDLTSSSLTHGIKNPRPEANKFRIKNSELIFEENYGVLEITKDEKLLIQARIKTGMRSPVISEKLFTEVKK